MSFLGGTARSNGSGVDPQKIEMAVAEVDMLTDFFSRMTSQCHTKCIGTRYSEGDLTKGEMVCIDRCVAKFNAVQAKVGDSIQSRGAAMNAQAGGAGFPKI